jgi:starch synthase
VKLRILVAASEVVGFAKTGGLADVAGSLPRALAERGHEVAIVMPYYRGVRLGKHFVERAEHVIPVPVGNRNLACRLFRSQLPDSNVKIFFIDEPEYFDRDDATTGKGLYQQNMPGGYKADYPDNAERFVFFSRAVLEAMHEMNFVPDIIHANDWQTGLVPVFLHEVFKQRPEYENTRSIYTIHNIAYQGMFGADVMRLTRLPGYLFNHNQLEFHGHFNFLKAGVVYGDAINTVSPTYAREIQTPEYGCGMEGLLQVFRSKLSGIMNGVDYGTWNPAIDPHLPKNYDSKSVFEVKPKIKAELQRRYNLPLEPDKPLLGLVARLVGQKGIDLVLSAAPGFLDLGCQMVFLGEGDPEFHNELQQFRDKHPNQVGTYLGYHETLAHLVEGGSDLFLMPSRYEPSGLNQLYSMKYGTPPVVRSTGGLADSVVGATVDTLAKGTATGFSFDAYTPDALYQTVKWAVALYRDQPKQFQQVVLTAMKQDWSWNRSAAEYEALYYRVLGRTKPE